MPRRYGVVRGKKKKLRATVVAARSFLSRLLTRMVEIFAGYPGGGASVSQSAAFDPLPQLAKYESDMNTWVKLLGSQVMTAGEPAGAIVDDLTRLSDSARNGAPWTPNRDTGLYTQNQKTAFGDWEAIGGAGFYDYGMVAYRCYDYTGETIYKTYAEAYVQAAEEMADFNEFTRSPKYTRGIYRHPHGIARSVAEGGVGTMAALRYMRDGPHYGEVHECYDYLRHAEYARPVSFLLESHIEAEKLGDARQTASANKADVGIVIGDDRVKFYVECLENAMRQWRNNDYTNPTSATNNKLQPFMAALASRALISYYDWEVANSRDPDAHWTSTQWPNGILSCLVDFWTWIFSAQTTEATPRDWYKASTGEWAYSDDGGAYYYIDNLWIAPVYAWLYKTTGQGAYITTYGDVIWEAGVLNNSGTFSVWPKNINRQYFWSTKYIDWRNGA